jgi:hypothetical protein
VDCNGNFDCAKDVDAHFATQHELWRDPKPDTPTDLFDKIEEGRSQISIAEWYSSLLSVVFPFMSWE